MARWGEPALVITLRRAYDPPAGADGPRVLVDRLWPRGVTRADLRIVAWLRDIGPSTALRKWFGHDPARWQEFRRRYRRELAAKTQGLHELRTYARRGCVTLVYGARDPEHNEAVVIREALQRRAPGRVAAAGSRKNAAVTGRPSRAPRRPRRSARRSVARRRRPGARRAE